MSSYFLFYGYQKFIQRIATSWYAKIKLTANQLSVIQFLFGLLSAWLLARGEVWWSFGALNVSGFFDTLDGAVAHVSGSAGKKGALVDDLTDRLTELSFVVALVALHEIDWFFALALIMIMNVSSIIKYYSRFDLGLKRVVFILGYFIGFGLAVQVVFWGNLLNVWIGLVIYDLRTQKEEDRVFTRKDYLPFFK